MTMRAGARHGWPSAVPSQIDIANADIDDAHAASIDAFLPAMMTYLGLRCRCHSSAIRTVKNIGRFIF